MKFIIIFTLLLNQVAFAENLPPQPTLEEPITGPLLNLGSYIAQVQSRNLSAKSNEYASKSFRLRIEEASLDFMPYVVGGATYTDDKRGPYSISTGFGNEGITQAWDLGVSEKFRTGTNVTLTYNWTYSHYIGSLFFPPSATTLYTADPQITITQPLWKDFNASLSKANEEFLEDSYKAQEINSRYSTLQILFNAETAYWTLALNREVVRLDKESLERSDKILKYNDRRVRMNVTDRSELLQSLADVKSKELILQTDIETLRQSSLQFNSVRNVAGDSVTEKLEPIDQYLQGGFSAEIKKVRDRADVLAAGLNAESQRAQAKASKIKVEPDISLNGTYQFNGIAADANTAYGTSFNGDHPYLTVGLTLKIPLDQGTVSKLNEGYQAQSAAAQATLERSKFDLDQDWIDLQKHFADAMYRLNLAKELEKIQGEKLHHERDRFTAGRTTSFQVLQFEDTFSAAELSRLRIENDLITLRAKARLYNGEVK
jgi:outer membrane protein TolC